MRYFILCLSISFLFFACAQKKTTENETASASVQQNDTVAKKTDTAQQNVINPAAASTVLTVSPLEESGNQGQVTFTQKDNTVFYYDRSSKKGKIKLNGTEYILDKYSEGDNSFKISGKEVSIDAPNCKYDKNEGSDCFYGKIPVVT